MGETQQGVSLALCCRHAESDTTSSLGWGCMLYVLRLHEAPARAAMRVDWVQQGKSRYPMAILRSKRKSAPHAQLLNACKQIQQGNIKAHTLERPAAHALRPAALHSAAGALVCGGGEHCASLVLWVSE